MSGKKTCVISDADTNIVFVSDRLAQQNPPISSALTNVLGDRLRVIPGTKDIWCRDYMPVQVAAERFVQFTYTPDYMGELRHLEHQDR